MRFKLAILPIALLAASFEPALAQAKAPAQPDHATVTRLQTEIAQAEAKGDFQAAEVKLRILAGLYKNDPSMRSITYQQLAQVSTQLHDDAKAAQYRALAQGLPATVSVAPAPAPQQPVAAPVSTADIFAAPPTSPPVSAGAAPPKTSSADRFSKIIAEAQQIVAQAQQAAKQKVGNNPPPDQPLPPQPNAFPAAPDGMPPAAAPLPPPLADVPVAAGVVIGYDANNQPIFAPPPPAQPGGQAPPPPPPQ